MTPGTGDDGEIVIGADPGIDNQVSFNLAEDGPDLTSDSNQEQQ